MFCVTSLLPTGGRKCTFRSFTAPMYPSYTLRPIVRFM